MTLYEIQSDIDELLQSAFAEAEESDGEVSEETAAQLEDLQVARDDKIGSLTRYYKNLRAISDTCTHEAKTLSARARTAQNRMEWLKGYLKAALDGQKWGDGVCTISYRKSVKTIIDDVDALPEGMYKTERKPIASEIKHNIEMGNTVPGAHLETSHNIQIK